MTIDFKLCPDCGEPSLSNADGVLHCTNCGWSEEDLLDCGECSKSLDVHAGIGLPCPIPQSTDLRSRLRAALIRFLDYFWYRGRIR